MEKENLLEAAKNDNMYDFIANNYHNMTKDELKDVCLELAYATYRVLRNDKKLTEKYLEALVENIEERFV